MKIRKKFEFEGAHIVRNCSSDRCKKSIHGHSYIVEVLLKSDHLDHGNMVMDFGLLKGNIKALIDSFDHAYSMWNKEHDDFKEFIKRFSARWIELPMSPSAEGYAVMFAFIIDKIIKNTVFKNGEKNIEVSSVRVHETATGYAEADMKDVENLMKGIDLEKDFIFSKQIEREWKQDHKFLIKTALKIPFINKEVEITHK